MCYFLQANPPVGKDNPPDLADLVPSDSIVLPDPPEQAASLQGPRNDHVVSDNKSTEITGAFLPECDPLNHVLEQDKIANACVFHLFSKLNRVLSDAKDARPCSCWALTFSYLVFQGIHSSWCFPASMKMSLLALLCLSYDCF